MNSIVGKQQVDSNTPFILEEDEEDHLLNEQMYYKKLCLKIADSLNVFWLFAILLGFLLTHILVFQILDKNWETGNYQEEIVLRGPVVGPVNSITFLMNEKHIVRHVDSEKTFQFFNRWSLELEEVCT